MKLNPSKLLISNAKLNRLALVFFGVVTLVGCSASSTDPADAFRNQPMERVYQGGEQAYTKEKYTTAIKHFEALDSLYPFGPYAEQTDLHLIYAYYQNGDMACAEAAAGRFVRLYPRSEHVDYAYYMKGLAGFEQDRGWFQRFAPMDLSQRDPGYARQSFDDFGTLVRLFPESCYAADARQHMVYLRNLLGNYELHVATFYCKRGAYVAAANRANFILSHYQGTPAVHGALAILVRSYNALGLPDLASQAYAVLQANYG